MKLFPYLFPCKQPIQVMYVQIVFVQLKTEGMFVHYAQKVEEDVEAGTSLSHVTQFQGVAQRQEPG